MLKAIIFLSKVILFIFILSIVALMYGINLVNLSFNNINISQLYLKYDKELILNIKDLTIENKNKIDEMKISIRKIENKYQINIINFEQNSTNIKFQTNTLLTYKEIKRVLNNKKHKIIFNNLYFKYDPKLPYFFASKVYSSINKNNINFKFLNPIFNNIKLDGSTIDISDLKNNPELHINLQTNNFLDKNLLDILAYYKVKIPIKQIKGKNNIKTEIIFPFKSQILTINYDINIKDSSLIYDKIKIFSKNINIKSLNDKIKINSKRVYFNGFEQKLLLDDFIVNIKNNTIYINSTINDESNNSVYLNQSINIKNKNSKGNILINKYIINKNIILKNQILNFDFDFKNEFDLNVYTKNINIDDLNISLFSPKLNYNKNNIIFDTNIKDNYNNNFLINSSTNLISKKIDGSILIQNYKYKNILDLKNKKLKFIGKFGHGIKFFINELDLVFIKNRDKYSLNIGKLNKVLNHIKFIKINKWNKDTSFNLYSDNNFKHTNIFLGNLDIELKNDFFEKEDKEKVKKMTKTIFPKIDLVLLDSSIKIKNRLLAINYSYLKTTKSKIIVEIKPVNERSKINMIIEDEKLYIDARNISDNFINKLTNKTIFESGSIDFTARGYVNDFNGKLTLNNTTLMDVRIVNNLITFINTTPALINPILALPTLFRMAETKFDMQGYFIKKGEIEFNYNGKNKILNISKFYTKSKMTDSKGYGNVNFDKETIDLNVDVIFLKDYSKFIKHIPILGYIIVGENGNFITNVDINGTFKEQNFTTHTVTDAAQGTMGMIKRTFSIPLFPFMDGSNKPASDEIIDKITNQEE